MDSPCCLPDVSAQVIYVWSWARTGMEGEPIWWAAQTLYYLGFVVCFAAMATRTWRIVVLFSRVPRLRRVKLTRAATPRSRSSDADSVQRDGAASPQQSDGPTDAVLLRCCCWELVRPPAFERKRLDTPWCLRRLALAVSPVCVVTFVLLPVGLTKAGEMLWTVYDLAALCTFMLVASRLYCIRSRVTLEELVETKMLLFWALTCGVYFVIDNVQWLGFVRKIDVHDTNGSGAATLGNFVIVQLVFFAAMVSLNVGWVVAEVWRTTRELQRAKGAQLGRSTLNPLAGLVSDANGHVNQP